MRIQDILAAAENVRATDNTPFYLSLLAIAISIVALYRASASGKNLHQVPVPPATPPDVNAPQANPVVISAPPSSPVLESQAIPIEIVAVIAAAVAATIGNNHRIVSIKPMSSSWERAGRQSVLTSHRIR